jgi:hypothetical protein
LISHAFVVFAYLLDLPVAEVFRLSHNPRGYMQVENYDASRFSRLQFYLGIGRTIGLLLAFGYAILLARTRNGNWVNPAVAAVISFLLGVFNLLAWSLLQNIFLSPGSPMSGALYYLVNGAVLLLLGMGIIYFNHLALRRKHSMG